MYDRSKSFVTMQKAVKHFQSNCSASQLASYGGGSITSKYHFNKWLLNISTL